MAENEEKKDAAESVNNFLTKNLKILIAVSAAVVVVIVAWALVSTFSAKSAMNAIDAVESVNYSFVREASGLEGDALTEKQNATLAALKPYIAKSGPAATRANLLAADIYFAQKNYEEARKCYLNATNQKKAYTASISYFNAAICSEELGDLDKAASYYEIASKDTDFLFVTHAVFSLGRVYEEKGDFSKAGDTYQKLFDKSPDDSWAKLSMDRLVALKTEGKIQ